MSSKIKPNKIQIKEIKEVKKKPLVIWHLLSNRWFSAISAYAINTARSLELEGHTCIFTPLQGSPAEQHAINLGLKINAVVNFNWSQKKHLAALEKSINPDIIVVYGGPETFLSRFIIKDRTVLARFRGDQCKIKYKIQQKLQAWSHSHIDLFITPSKRLNQLYQGMYKSKPVKTIPLGVDTQVFQPRSYGKPENGSRPKILIFGRLDPVKGHEAFIEIFASMLELWKKSRLEKETPILQIVGKPANTSVLQILDKAQKMDLKVGYDIEVNPEYIKNVPDLLSQACLGVISSLASEEICRVAQEFLLCGTPVFVSGVGALNEVLSFKEAGLSYKNMPTLESAETLFSFVQQSARETQKEKQARAQEAKKLFSLEQMGRALNECLLE